MRGEAVQVRVDPRLTDDAAYVVGGDAPPDPVVIRCRLAVTMSTRRGPLYAGTWAYVLRTHHARLKPNRMLVLGRSRSGEWWDVWTSQTLLEDFEPVRLRPGDELHDDRRLLPAVDGAELLPVPVIEMRGGTAAQVRAELDGRLARIRRDQPVVGVRVEFGPPPPQATG